MNNNEEIKLNLENNNIQENNNIENTNIEEKTNTNENNNVQENNELKIDYETIDDSQIEIDSEVKAEIEEKYKKIENQIKKNKRKRYLKNLAMYSILALIAGIVYFFIQPFKNISKFNNALIVVGIVFVSYIINVIIEELMELYFKNKKEKGKK